MNTWLKVVLRRVNTWLKVVLRQVCEQRVNVKTHTLALAQPERGGLTLVYSVFKSRRRELYLVFCALLGLTFPDRVCLLTQEMILRLRLKQQFCDPGPPRLVARGQVARNTGFR